MVVRHSIAGESAVRGQLHLHGTGQWCRWRGPGVPGQRVGHLLGRCRGGRRGIRGHCRQPGTGAGHLQWRWCRGLGHVHRDGGGHSSPDQHFAGGARHQPSDECAALVRSRRPGGDRGPAGHRHGRAVHLGHLEHQPADPGRSRQCLPRLHRGDWRCHIHPDHQQFPVVFPADHRATRLERLGRRGRHGTQCPDRREWDDGHRGGDRRVSLGDFGGRAQRRLRARPEWLCGVPAHRECRAQPAGGHIPHPHPDPAVCQPAGPELCHHLLEPGGV